MSTHDHLRPSDVRARINHPVIDADGHWLEFGPAVLDALERIGGKAAVKGFAANPIRVSQALSMSVAERQREHIAQEAWWASPTRNTRDRATAMLPRLFVERMEELGLDYSVLYPTAGLSLPRLPDAEIRQATCRAFNVYTAERFAEFADRVTPAAVIPMHSPQEALAELDYATGELGLKVIMMGSLIRRPIPALADTDPGLAQRFPWLDVLGLDSAHDYDPVWARCVELGLSPTFHSGSRGLGMRVSASNFVFNHIGHFAAASEAVCKGLFLGGVTRRFPTLNIGFLEGGVGWACQLYADLIGHWEKRNLAALEEVRPENLDEALLLELAERYDRDGIAQGLRTGSVGPDLIREHRTGGIGELDDYAACEIERREDFRKLFAERFYFGCEADDPMNAWAFNDRANPCGVKLKTLFGSDVGHFDVADMSHVLPEAYELADEGLITDADFRDFVFTNPVRFWGESNPRFFDGTAVEEAARAELAG